ncbi:hypothetical protein LCGC14_2208000 [marine sediment metagenome]|uniref:Uncharacterized protein n=1 Tax=marine sediment metagenome TaxID=412755 RepID=A0A0F9FS00_9ZZZZ
MIYIGIDPGLDGAMAVLRSDQRSRVVFIDNLFDTPSTSVVKGRKKRRVYDTSAMARLFRTYLLNHRREEIIVALEAVHAMPGQGVTSMFSMGRGFGQWEGIIAAFQLPLEYVTPRVWKNKMVGVGTDKNASRLKAIDLFPGVADQLARKKDHGRAEALLIAEYVRRRNGDDP